MGGTYRTPCDIILPASFLAQLPELLGALK
jgi:hypothetical protein